MRCSLLAIPILLFATFLGQAQPGFLSFTRIGPDSGLPQRPVHGVAKDRRSVVWVEVQDVLAEHDGSDFRVYKLREAGLSHAALIVIVLLVMYLLHRLRVRNMQRRMRLLQSEIDERTTELQKKTGELADRDVAIREAREDLRRTQVQLTNASNMASLGQLTAGIAHEIKNPLNFINNFAAIVADLAEELKSKVMQCAVDLDKERRSEMDALADDLSNTAEKIVQHGQRIDGIVKSMLLHAHGKPGEKEQVELNRFVDQYVMLSWHGMRAQRQDFNVRLDKHYDDTVGSHSIIPQDFARVLINLLNNAFQAVLDRQSHDVEGYLPEVSVSTILRGSRVEIEICDNGGGVPVELEERIFEPFFTTKSSASGTGLGLSLSYDILVEGHQGGLRLDNRPGDGASFVISLPE